MCSAQGPGTITTSPGRYNITDIYRSVLLSHRPAHMRSEGYGSWVCVSVRPETSVMYSAGNGGQKNM